MWAWPTIVLRSRRRYHVACFVRTRAALIFISQATVFAGFAFLLNSWLRLRRAEFTRTCRWSPGLLQKLIEHHPSLSHEDAVLVSRGLRQFWIAFLMNGRRFVSMPSCVADDRWHEFIPMRATQRGCRSCGGGGGD
jgi:hypothetical protein